jgi:hypothetical protein
MAHHKAATHPMAHIRRAFTMASGKKGQFPRVRHQPLQVFDLLEVATLNCHYSNVI